MAWLGLCVPCSAPHIVQSQLQEVLGAVVYADFPEAWPGLLDTIMGHLTSNVSNAAAMAAAVSSPDA